MQYYGLDWLAMTCGLTGVYLLGSRNKFGFLLFMIASLSWIATGVMMQSIPVMCGSAIFFILHLRGFLNWSKETK